jgi:hypothetical protein
MSRGPTGKWLLAGFAHAGLIAIGSEASGQDALGGATRLPPIELSAPEGHQGVRRKSAARAAGQWRLARTPAAVGAAAANTAANRNPDANARSPVTSSSEKNVTGDEINTRPFSRPAEALEAVPGLIVTQHSGDGKANQYFLRGFNLDHGTDLAISVDGMPVNMRTHAHGQGYADLNFLIPELIGSVNIRKGPYFADEGDFSSVGSVHVSLLDSIRSMASVTVGSFGYRRGLGITSAKLGEGTLLVAGEVNTNNTVQRQFLSPIRSDSVQEGSVGIFAQNTLHGSDCLRTTVGWRGDFYNGSVLSYFTPANSGNANAFIGSPKFGMVLGPFAKTEFFINAGEGFHSNDARGVTITESPTDGSPLQSSPFLVKTRGAEVGLRSKLIPGLTSAVSVFLLDSASEILFSGDAGDTEASRPSRRCGVEWTNDYRPLS